MYFDEDANYMIFEVIHVDWRQQSQENIGHGGSMSTRRMVYYKPSVIRITIGKASDERGRWG